MRNSDQISDQAYGTYLEKINSLYGTKLLSTPKEQSRAAFIERLQGEEQTDANKALLENLTNPERLAENRNSKHYY